MKAGVRVSSFPRTPLAPRSNFTSLFSSNRLSWSIKPLQPPISRGMHSWDPHRYSLYFHPHTCNVCKKFDDKETKTHLESCAKCKSVWYCGRDHQIKDFEAHKTLCEFLPETAEVISSDNIKTQRDWHNYINKCLTYTTRAIGRGLTDMESKTFMYQEICYACYTSKLQGAKLESCPHCHITSLCSQGSCKAGEEKRLKMLEDHKSQCGEFKLIVECERAILAGKIPAVPLPPILETEYKPLPQNWDEYWERRKLPQMEEAIKRMLYDNLAMPLTVLYAAQRLFPDLSTREKLRVHLVGGEPDREGYSPYKYEEILHLLPNLKELEIVIVGPYAGFNSSRKQQICEECQKLNRQYTLTFRNQLYQDFMKTASYERPDFAVMFNSGMYDTELSPGRWPPLREAWTPALVAVLESKMPAVFTSYTPKESLKDTERLQELNAKFILDPHVNPFHGGQPKKTVSDFSKVHYDSMYIMGVAGTAV